MVQQITNITYKLYLKRLWYVAQFQVEHRVRLDFNLEYLQVMFYYSKTVNIKTFGQHLDSVLELFSTLLPPSQLPNLPFSTDAFLC